ncbi:hypothetical protein LXL04_010351 [Taraxacum kok-saghyz]
MWKAYIYRLEHMKYTSQVLVNRSFLAYINYDAPQDPWERLEELSHACTEDNKPLLILFSSLHSSLDAQVLELMISEEEDALSDHLKEGGKESCSCSPFLMMRDNFDVRPQRTVGAPTKDYQQYQSQNQTGEERKLQKQDNNAKNNNIYKQK